MIGARRHPQWLIAVLAVAIGPSRTEAPSLVLGSPLVVFSALEGGPNPPPQTVPIANGGPGQLTWRIANPGRRAPWLTVGPPSGTAPAGLRFDANVAGLRPGRYQDSVEVATDDSTGVIVVVLSVAPRPGGPGTPIGRYEIELKFTGYTGLIEGAPNCQVDTLGFDLLVGTVAGAEPPTPDEDVIYTGALRRFTRIDLCESKGRRQPDDDERVWCSLRLIGSAVEEVELTVSGEDGRGAWLKADPWPAPIYRSIRGDCDPQQTSDALTGYPGSSDGGGASPNGQPIDDPQSGLFVGNRARLRVGYWPAQGPKAGWALRVLRKLP